MEGTRLQDRSPDGLEALARERMQDARPVSDIVTEMLRQAVLGGLLKGGQVLRQDELATTFGVSRMPVREALRQLETEGLVSHLPRRGFVVATLTDHDVEEIYEIRALLEGYAMRLAVPRLDDARLDNLEKLHALMHKPADPHGLVDMRETFYRTLYEAAERPKLLRLIMQLRADVARYLLARQAPFSSESHADLLTICRRRDSRAAEQFIRAHLRRVASMLKQVMDKGRRRDEEGSQLP